MLRLVMGGGPASPPKSHLGELNRAGNVAFPMTSSGKAMEGGKCRLGFPGWGTAISCCGILPFVWQQTVPLVTREAKTSCTIASAAQRCQTVHPETCACPCALSWVFRAPKQMPGLEMEALTSMPPTLPTPVRAPTCPLVCLPAAPGQLYDIYVRPGRISRASHAPCLAKQQNVCSIQRQSDPAPRKVARRMLAGHLAPAKGASEPAWSW